MGKWRTLFETSLPPVAEREYGEEYEFGPPATLEQIEEAERALGFGLPTEVREMLAEFNGIWELTRFDDGELNRKIHYLDLQQMCVEVPNYFARTDNPKPPRYALRNVVFIAQSNGFAGLWGYCVADFPRHQAGTIVRLDHGGGSLKFYQPSLEAFVRVGLYGESGQPISAPAEGEPTSDLPGLSKRRDEPSFADWADAHPADLIAECEQAITESIDRLIELGPTPSEEDVRAEIESCISQFDQLQWSRGEPWIGDREQTDIVEALNELIERSGFEATEEWTEVRDW